ncbi:polyribonucleotide nucleotidyltransferase [Bartonella sp. WD12.1]|nr:polyribonucleotide nucleotidyltransferase [Bartonella sp. WD12.1]
MLEMVEKDLQKAYTITDKQERHTAIDAIKANVVDKFMSKIEENCEFNADQIATVSSIYS